MKTFIVKDSHIGIQTLAFYQQVLRVYKSQGIKLPCTQKAVELIEKQLRHYNSATRLTQILVSESQWQKN